ncbi:MAG: ABC transporter permease [Pseudomonadota bacterium]
MAISNYLVNLVAFTGISVPGFWFALLLIVVFAVHFGVLPAGGTGATESASGFDAVKFFILPIATLCFATIGDQIRFMRGSMIEALRQDYVRTARAKGVSEPRVVMRHAFPNALNPVITVLGLQFGALFSGALVTEIVFSWPGMGRLIFDAIMGNDFNLALVALMLATAATLIGSLLTDLIYGWLDPRVTYE